VISVAGGVVEVGEWEERGLAVGLKSWFVM